MATKKTTICPATGKRHKWVWKKNVSEFHIGPMTGSMKLRGRYECSECGAVRIGAYR